MDSLTVYELSFRKLFSVPDATDPPKKTTGKFCTDVSVSVQN